GGSREVDATISAEIRVTPRGIVDLRRAGPLVHDSGAEQLAWDTRGAIREIRIMNPPDRTTLLCNEEIALERESRIGRGGLTTHGAVDAERSRADRDGDVVIGASDAARARH